MLGASNYLGDLAPVAFLPSATFLSGGAFARINFNQYLSAKTSIYRGTIAASDAYSPNEFRKARNLSFRSNITEFALIPEINIPGYYPIGWAKPLSVYLFAGIALYHYNPKAKYKGIWYELQPLGTEGQGMPGFKKKYALTQFSFPVGGGIKFALNEYWNIGVEIGGRKTYNDYLDDVSGNYVARQELIEGNGILAANLANREGEYLGTSPVSHPTGSTPRADAKYKDWYVFTGVTLSYNFVVNFDGSGFNGGKKGLHCPSFLK
jgi:hypothetical protein